MSARTPERKTCFVCQKPVRRIEGGWPTVAMFDPVRGLGYAVVCSEACAGRLRYDRGEQEAFDRLAIQQSGLGAVLEALLAGGLIHGANDSTKSTRASKPSRDTE